jgi:hypothetical protein
MATDTAILFCFRTLLANKLTKVIKKAIKKLIGPEISFLRCLSRVLIFHCAELGPGCLGFYRGQANRQALLCMYIYIYILIYVFCVIVPRLAKRNAVNTVQLKHLTEEPNY